MQQMLHQEPMLHHELNLISQVWEADALHDAEYLEATYILHLQRMEKLGIAPGHTTGREKDRHFHSGFDPALRRKVVALAVLVLVVGLYIVISRSMPGSAPAQATTSKVKAPLVAATEKGNRTQLTLPDGSEVWLNSGSKLNYEKINGGNNREVYLTGEAYFKVKRNTARPFIIHTSTIDIKVLGTEFNVRAYPDDARVETSLIHGSVQVNLKHDPSQQFVLKPNEKLVLYKTTEQGALRSKAGKPALAAPKVAIEPVSYLQGATVAVETDWMRNLLSFNDETFEDVARKLERWYNVDIEFGNDRLKQERLIGSFENETLLQAMEALKFTTRFTYRIEGNKVLIY